MRFEDHAAESLSEVTAVGKAEQPHKKEVVLVASPVIRVRQPEAAPKLAHGEHFLEFFDEGFLAAEELNEFFSTMRHCESIMPCVSFHIVIRENVDSLLFAERNKGAVLVLTIEETRVLVPKILVKL